MKFFNPVTEQTDHCISIQRRLKDLYLTVHKLA